MRGGPIDLTPFGAVLTAIGWLYWLVALACLIAALWFPKRLWFKLSAAAVVGFLFVYPIAQHAEKQRQGQDEAKARLDKAMALFNERCKDAGEKIARTVESVDGVVWMKWRPKEVSDGDQFALSDPYGQDCYGDECIKRLLRVTKGFELNPEEAKAHASGYRYVETIDPADGKRYRYVAVVKSVAQRTPDQIQQYKRNSGGRDPGPDVYGFSLEREPIDAYTARYGLTWEDVSTQEDRVSWIAGGSLKVIDLQTNELLAESRGYLIDTGQGSTAGFRSPWGWAKTYAPRCPRVSQSTWEFSMKVIKPASKGE